MDITNAVVGTVSSSSYSDKTKNTDFYDGSSKTQDGVTGQDSFWQVKWEDWHGLYFDVPIFAAVIDTLACWAVGKGLKCKNKEDEKILKKITGWGKDDFNSIIENLTRVMLCGGDSHAEIVKDKAGRLTNLKPLNPQSIKVVVNPHGIISKYQQTLNGEVSDFNKKKVFHLCWDRLADEIHGKPYAERVQPLIKQIKQLGEDLSLRFHMIVKPVRLFAANTDDATALTATEAKLKSGYEKCDIIVIPEGTLEAKELGNIPNAQDAIEYYNFLIRLFVSACNVPEVILGWGEKSTEATSKIIYLAFQQRIERIQKFLEEQIRLQLGIELNFEFPASLEPMMTETQAQGNAPFAKETPKIETPAQDNAKAGKINNIMKK